MSFASRFGWWIPIVVLTASLPAHGQQLGAKSEVEDAFQKVRLAFIRDYATGTFEPKKDVLDLAAQFYVYRITWPNATSDSATMATAVHEFRTQLVDQILHKEYVKRNQKFQEMFAPMLVNRFRELTALEFQANAKVLLNGAQMLQPLGRIKHDEVGKYLAELLDDPAKHDAIKLFAAKGLHENFPIHVLVEEDFPDDKLKKRRDSEARRVEALERFILRPPPSDASQDELRAFVYIRREAIAAMAAAGAPAVSFIKREGEPKGVVVPVLLRVLLPALRPDQEAPANDMRLKPLPSIAEKVEAAIGVLHAIPEQKKIEGYQSQTAAYLFGRFVKEFGEAYNEDLPNLRQKDRKPPVIPWKIAAKRLEQAWVEAGGASKSPLPPDFKRIELPVRDILKQMSDYGTINERLVELSPLLKAPEPKNRALFPTSKKPHVVDWE